MDVLDRNLKEFLHQECILIMGVVAYTRGGAHMPISGSKLQLLIYNSLGRKKTFSTRLIGLEYIHNSIYPKADINSKSPCINYASESLTDISYVRIPKATTIAVEPITLQSVTI